MLKNENMRVIYCCYCQRLVGHHIWFWKSLMMSGVVVVLMKAHVAAVVIMVFSGEFCTNSGSSFSGLKRM